MITTHVVEFADVGCNEPVGFKSSVQRLALAFPRLVGSVYSSISKGEGTDSAVTRTTVKYQAATEHEVDRFLAALRTLASSRYELLIDHYSRSQDSDDWYRQRGSGLEIVQDVFVQGQETELEKTLSTVGSLRSKLKELGGIDVSTAAQPMHWTQASDVLRKMQNFQQRLSRISIASVSTMGDFVGVCVVQSRSSSISTLFTALADAHGDAALGGSPITKVLSSCGESITSSAQLLSRDVVIALTADDMKKGLSNLAWAQKLEPVFSRYIEYHHGSLQQSAVRCAQQGKPLPGAVLSQ